MSLPFFSFSEKYLEILKRLRIFAPKLQIMMRIISKSTLVEYYTRVPQAKTALEEWYEKTKKSVWHRSRVRLLTGQH